MKRVLIVLLSITLVVLTVMTAGLIFIQNKTAVQKGLSIGSQEGSSHTELPYADSPSVGDDVDLRYLYTEQEVMNALNNLEIVDASTQKEILFKDGVAHIKKGINSYRRGYSVTKVDGIYQLTVDDCTYEIMQSEDRLVMNCRGFLYTMEVN